MVDKLKKLLTFASFWALPPETMLLFFHWAWVAVGGLRVPLAVTTIFDCYFYSAD
jgi:hypothetical protein